MTALRARLRLPLGQVYIERFVGKIPIESLYLALAARDQVLDAVHRVTFHHAKPSSTSCRNLHRVLRGS